MFVIQFRLKNLQYLSTVVTVNMNENIHVIQADVKNESFELPA